MEAIERLVDEGHNAFPGAFGENLTLRGIEMDSLAEGSRLAIGDALVIEVTEPAAPCSKQAQWFSDGRFARISSRTHPSDARWYARVIREGHQMPERRRRTFQMCSIGHLRAHSRSSTVR